MLQALFIGLIAAIAAVILAFVDVKGKSLISLYVAAIVVIIVAYMMWSDDDFKSAGVKEPDKDVLVSVKEKWANKGEAER